MGYRSWRRSDRADYFSTIIRTAGRCSSLRSAFVYRVAVEDATFVSSSNLAVVMRYARRFLLSWSIILFVTSCATASQSGERRSESRNRLSHQELVDTSELTLYDAIQRLRPLWLRTRGAVSARGAAPVVVYVDNVRIGYVNNLHNIPVESVQAVSFVSASDATTRWGLGVSGGVILVISRSG